jgi:hypothetical protein
MFLLILTFAVTRTISNVLWNVLAGFRVVT